MPQRHQTTAGFTLIEMAIVVALFGLMVGGGLLGLGQFLDQIALKETEKSFAKVEKALSLYVLQEGWLPCPDTTGDGVMDVAGSACTAGSLNTPVQGMVPYRDLGLMRDDATDGWHVPLTYVVSWGLAAPRGTDINHQGSLKGYLDCATSGALSYDEFGDATPSDHDDGPAFMGVLEPVEDASGAGSIWADPDGNTDFTAYTDPVTADKVSPLSDDPPRAAYVLISHGENAHGGYIWGSGNQRSLAGAGTDEQHNAQAAGARADNGNRLSREIVTGFNQQEFDDIVRSRTPAQILYDIGCRNDGTI